MKPNLSYTLEVPQPGVRELPMSHPAFLRS